MNIAEIEAANTLLDRGIKVPVTAPLCLRVFGKRKVNVVIRQPYLGTLYRISKLYLAMQISDEQLELIEEQNAHNLFVAHGRALSAIAAQAILNGKWSGRVFGRLLSNWLYWHLSPLVLMSIARSLTALSGTTAFTNTIRSVRMMKMTSPTLSQKMQGS